MRDRNAISRVCDRGNPITSKSDDITGDFAVTGEIKPNPVKVPSDSVSVDSGVVRIVAQPNPPVIIADGRGGRHVQSDHVVQDLVVGCLGEIDPAPVVAADKVTLDGQTATDRAVRRFAGENPIPPIP